MNILASFVALVCIIILIYLFSVEKANSLSKKLESIVFYAWALLIQAVAWIFAGLGETYVTNYENTHSNNQCPLTNRWEFIVTLLGILSILFVIVGLVFAIKSKQPRKIVAAVLFALAIGFLGALATFTSTFCLPGW